MSEFRVTTTNKETDEFYLIVNERNEFLYHIYEKDGAEFIKNIENAEKFRKNKSGKLSFPKFYRYVNNQKVRNVEQLAEVVGGKVVKIEAETVSETNYLIKTIYY